MLEKLALEQARRDMKSDQLEILYSPAIEPWTHPVSGHGEGLMC